jgi:hypothetical protein
MRLRDWRLEIGDWESRPISNLQSPISQSPNLPRSLGCDIEFIEPREGNFCEQLFYGGGDGGGAAGLSRFRDADFNRRGAGDAGADAPSDILTTAIWSGKEAVLKALREGLRIDTRRITCRFDPFDAPPQEWTPFTVVVDEGLAAQFPGVWSGWWRVKVGLNLC